METLLTLSFSGIPAFAIQFLREAFKKDPFQGVYEPNAFDLAIVVPYFIILVVLSIYGIHRYHLTYLYLKNRQKRPRPAGHFEELPRITVQLPIYNERYVVGRLLEAVTRFDYPRDRLEIQVLDDSTDDTRHVASALVAEYTRAGLPISYHHRSHRRGFKAGALAEGLKKATGEFIAIFDADFVPPPDTLLRMVHYFTHPKVAVVQGRWTWINRHSSVLTEVEAVMLDGHFVIEHGGRNCSGRFFNFNGTAGMWRRAAIEDAGGWQHDTLTEDTDLSYRAQLRGWKFVYDPTIECPSELPVEVNAFKSQQARWAKGLVQVGRKLLPVIWRSRQPLAVKVEATFHLTSPLAYPLMVVFSLILLPAMMIRFSQGGLSMLYLDLPLFLASWCSISTFYAVAQRELDPCKWRRRLKYIPFLMATGIGLAVSNARAVGEALLGKPSEFVRTPKFCVQDQSESWERKTYLTRANFISVMELSLAAYFLAATAYALRLENYLTAPFLFLFLLGYSYVGMMSLLQTPLRRLWAEWLGGGSPRPRDPEPAT